MTLEYIDVVLDAEDEVTPSFNAQECGLAPNVPNGRCAIHAVRTTHTSNAVNIALDACMELPDGSLLQRHNGTALEDAWHEIASNTLALTGTAHDDVKENQQVVHGFRYRLRYGSAQTNPIRIVVRTPLLGKRSAGDHPAAGT